MSNSSAAEPESQNAAQDSFVQFEQSTDPDVAQDEELAVGAPLPRTRMWWLAVAVALVAGAVVGHFSAVAHKSVAATAASRPVPAAQKVALSHDLVVPPLLSRLEKLDFPDTVTTTLVATDGATAAQRQFQLTAVLSRGLIVTVTAAMDASGGTTERVNLAPAVVAQPGLGNFYCAWCGHNARPVPAANRVTRELKRVQPHLIAALGAGLDSALRQTA
jgi:hypothetical protein